MSVKFCTFCKIHCGISRKTRTIFFLTKILLSENKNRGIFDITTGFFNVTLCSGVSVQTVDPGVEVHLLLVTAVELSMGVRRGVMESTQEEMTVSH